jgi:pSer/pThr/pTyr-binding forkhead associated (FHA) protein
MSRRFVEEVAGDMPEAYLVVGDNRHRLREENVIGRTTTADIVITDAQVTRRHAAVNAIDGKFVVIDMGGTNGTYVNGELIGSTPRVLRHGDVIRMGPIDIRYEEAPVKND